MRFRNSTRLLTENFRNVYKILLYGLIVAVVAISLSSALILPNLLDILRSDDAGFRGKGVSLGARQRRQRIFAGIPCALQRGGDRAVAADRFENVADRLVFGRLRVGISR